MSSSSTASPTRPTSAGCCGWRWQSGPAVAPARARPTSGPSSNPAAVPECSAGADTGRRGGYACSTAARMAPASRRASSLETTTSRSPFASTVRPSARPPSTNLIIRRADESVSRSRNATAGGSTHRSSHGHGHMPSGCPRGRMRLDAFRELSALGDVQYPAPIREPQQLRALPSARLVPKSGTSAVGLVVPSTTILSCQHHVGPPRGSSSPCHRAPVRCRSGASRTTFRLRLGERDPGLNGKVLPFCW